MKLFTRKRATAALSAVMAAFIFVPIAVALTIPYSLPPREPQTQAPTYFRKTVAVTDANLLVGYKFGAIPKGAFITGIKCYVTTVFNAATTNPISIGTTQTGSDVLAGGVTAGTNCVTTTLGFQAITAAAGLGLAVAAPAQATGSTGGFDLWVKFTPTGAAATTGSVTFIVEYVVNNDG